MQVTKPILKPQRAAVNRNVNRRLSLSAKERRDFFDQLRPTNPSTDPIAHLYRIGFRDILKKKGTYCCNFIK